VEILAHIKELLLLNDCVIIPGFGGFVSSYKSAGFHASRFTPPSKSVSFNRQLNFNDGLFINYLAGKEGISYFAASKKVSLLVQELNYRLTDGEEVYVPGVGFLQYNDHENLLFTPKINGNLNLDAYGMPSFSYEIPHTRNQIIPATSQRERDAVQVIFQKRILKKVLVAVPLLFVLAMTPLKNNKENLQISGLASLTEMMSVKEPGPNPVEKTSRKAEENELEKQAEVHPYYMIGGSFRSIENADAFMIQMKEKGYPHTRNLGIIKGLHYIALDSFASFNEARTAQEEFKLKSPGSGVWIYIKK